MWKLCKMRPEIEQLLDEDFKNSLLLMLDEFEGCNHQVVNDQLPIFHDRSI